MGSTARKIEDPADAWLTHINDKHVRSFPPAHENSRMALRWLHSPDLESMWSAVGPG